MAESDLFDSIKTAKRKRLLFGAKPLYELVSSLSAEALAELEAKHAFKFPSRIKSALLELGASSVANLYLHHPSMIYRFDEKNGAVSGQVTFASDICGNYFSFNPEAPDPETVYYCSHDPAGYAVVAPSFLEYLQSFVASGFNTLSLTESLELNDF